MDRILKLVLGLLAFFVVLVLAAIILVPMFVDPNDFRDDIARAVNEETGRSFELEGEIALSVFPWLGLEVGRMRLGNPPGFGDQPFVEIGSAAVGARLLPLLSKRLEVSTLRLDGARLRLVRLADGRANWEGLGGDNPSADRPPADGGTFKLESVGGLRLTDALVRYEDQGPGTVIEITVPTLSTGELGPGKAFPVEAVAEITRGEEAGRLAMELAGTVDVAEDFAAGTIEMLSFSVEGGAGDGRQALTARAPTVRFVVDGPSFEIEGMELDFEASGPDVPGGTQAGRIEAPRVTADLAAQTLAVPALTAEGAGLRATGEVAGSRIVDAPEFAGKVSVDEFSPRALFQRLGEPALVTADGDALGKAALRAGFRAGTEEIHLEGLQLQLDDSALSGSMAIGLGEVTRIRAALELDAIDLDRYLPPTPEEGAEPESAEDVPLAFDWLEGLDLDATIRAGRLKINGLTMTDVDGRAVARDGVLTLEPFGAALYGGQVRGSARLDARQAPASLRMQQSLSALQLQPFVADLAGFERLSGVAQLGAELTTSASTTADLMSGLNGALTFDLSDGALQGVNLWFEIQRAYALARGRPAPEKISPDTEFRQLTGTAVIRDGLLVNKDLVGGLPFLTVTGGGEVDLAAGAVDYRLNATVIRQAIDEATGELSELAGLSVPLRLSGALGSPSVKVDVGDLLRNRAEQEALQRLGLEGEDRKSAEEELKERARDKLRGLTDRLRKDD